MKIQKDLSYGTDAMQQLDIMRLIMRLRISYSCTAVADGKVISAKKMN